MGFYWVHAKITGDKLEFFKVFLSVQVNYLVYSSAYSNLNFQRKSDGPNFNTSQWKPPISHETWLTKVELMAVIFFRKKIFAMIIKLATLYIIVKTFRKYIHCLRFIARRIFFRFCFEDLRGSPISLFFYLVSFWDTRHLTRALNFFY